MPKKAGQPRICGPHLKYDKLKVVGYEKPISGRSQDWDAEIPDLHGAPTARDRDESKDRRLCAAVESDAQSGAIAGRRLAMCESDEFKADAQLAVVSKVLGVSLEEGSQRAVNVDLDAYKAYLDDPALSDAEKDQIVDALWKIVVCFVDLGFGMSPVQEVWGQTNEEVDSERFFDSNEEYSLTVSQEVDRSATDDVEDRSASTERRDS